MRYESASKLFKTSGAYFWTYPRAGAQKVFVFLIDCRMNHFNIYIYMYMSLGEHSFLCNSSASKKSGGSAQDPKRCRSSCHLREFPTTGRTSRIASVARRSVQGSNYIGRIGYQYLTSTRPTLQHLGTSTQNQNGPGPTCRSGPEIVKTSVMMSSPSRLQTPLT